MEKSLDLFEIIKESMDLKNVDLSTYSPLTLAYIGDSIYEIVIRTIIVTKNNMQVNKLNKLSSSMVNATTQAKIILSLQDYLTQEEITIYKRGRNSKTSSTAKNAKVIDYRNATGYETLIGYLYLNGETSRLLDIIKEGFKRVEVK